MHDAVVVVDGGVPDNPAYPPVVAFLGTGRPSERQQELGAVLLDGLNDGRRVRIMILQTASLGRGVRVRIEGPRLRHRILIAPILSRVTVAGGGRTARNVALCAPRYSPRPASS